MRAMAVSAYDVWSVFFCTPREFLACVACGVGSKDFVCLCAICVFFESNFLLLEIVKTVFCKKVADMQKMYEAVFCRHRFHAIMS